MKFFSALFIISFGFLVWACSGPNQDDYGLLDDPLIDNPEGNVGIQSYAPITLPHPSELIKIDNGICTIKDKSVFPADTFQVNLCGGIGTISVESAFIIEQHDSLDTLAPSLAFYESYTCEDLKLEEVRPGKICISTMDKQKTQCIVLADCDLVYLYVKGDNTVKLYVPTKKSCTITPN